jgi:hypothetical protein
VGGTCDTYRANIQLYSIYLWFDIQRKIYRRRLIDKFKVIRFVGLVFLNDISPLSHNRYAIIMSSFNFLRGFGNGCLP